MWGMETQTLSALEVTFLHHHCTTKNNVDLSGKLLLHSPDRNKTPANVGSSNRCKAVVWFNADSQKLVAFNIYCPRARRSKIHPSLSHPSDLGLSRPQCSHSVAISLSVTQLNQANRSNWKSSWVIRLHHVACKPSCAKLMKVSVIVSDVISIALKCWLLGRLHTTVSPVSCSPLPVRRLIYVALFLTIILWVR